MSRTRILLIVPPRRQSGVIAILILFIVAVVAISFLVSSLKSSSQTERDKVTAAALAQAKAALIGYAASVNLFGCTSPSDCPRPGEIPCPDTNDDGQAEPSCGNADGTTGQITRLGRLPWKTLGLPDLRDGYGERLWYAVSNNFKKHSRAFPLNSDTLGTISVRDQTAQRLPISPLARVRPPSFFHLVPPSPARTVSSKIAARRVITTPSTISILPTVRIIRISSIS